MTRSLRVAFLGFSLGFLVAAGWGLVHGSVHGVASFTPGIAGLAVTAVLALLVGVRERAARRWEEADEDEDAEDAEEAEDAEPAPRVVVVADEAATRIAVLEARLALEQEQLDAAMVAFAETDLMAMPGPIIAPDGPVDPMTVALEPLLRQQLLETLAKLVETHARPAATAHVADAPPGETGSPVPESHPRVP